MYEIKKKFVREEYLKELEERGFIPKDHTVNRPYIGPIVIGAFKYYAPLTSNIKKDDEGAWVDGMEHNTSRNWAYYEPIVGNDGKEYGVIDFRYMFPAPDSMVENYNINKKTDDRIQPKKTKPSKEELEEQKETLEFFMPLGGQDVNEAIKNVNKGLKEIDENDYKVERARIQRGFIKKYNMNKKENPYDITVIEMKAKINRENPWYCGKYFAIEKYVLDEEIKALRENKAPKDVVERVEKTKEHLIKKEAFLVYDNGYLEVDDQNHVYNKESVGKPIESVNNIENDIQKIARKGWHKW